MVKKIVFILALLFFIQHGSAQFSERGFGIVNLERHQVKLNLFGPGLSYELGILRNTSLSTSFGPSYAQYQEGYTLGFAWHLRMRFYHNFNRRLDRGKNVSGNSGNYIAAARSVFFGPLQISHNIDAPKDFGIGVYGLLYGVQRTYQKGMNFNVEVGGGYFRGDGVPNGYGPMLNFTVGWVATKRKSRKPVFD